MRGFITRGGMGLAATPGGVTPPPAQQVGGMVWTPATVNTDSSPITPGEITGYEVGIRPIAGTPGVYTIFLAVDGPFTSAQLIAAIQPPLSSGSYAAAVRSVGPIDSAWSNESFFTV